MEGGKEGEGHTPSYHGNIPLFAVGGSYLNNTHMQTQMAKKSSIPLSTGTTANEAFHNELRGAFRQVYKIHLPTMELRLGLFLMGKQVEWDAERRVPGLCQRYPPAVLSRVLAKPLIEKEKWQSSPLTTGARVVLAKANGPLRSQRIRHGRRVTEWVRKRPAGRVLKSMKRHVFNLKRKSHLVGGGKTWGNQRSSLLRGSDMV